MQEDALRQEDLSDGEQEQIWSLAVIQSAELELTHVSFFFFLLSSA